MKITFVSNYINHHQIPFCSAMYGLLGEDFRFIETQQMTQERMALGWAEEADMFAWCLFWDRNRQECEKLFLESDVVLLGWSLLPARLIEERLSSGKITLRITERIYKEGQWKALSPRGLKNKYKEHIRYRKQPVYLLCAGAYVASDFALIHAYPEKRFRWGYFPPFVERKKTQWDDGDAAQRLRLCWAGRMIDWKHPEFALMAARRLKELEVDFTLDMVGDGPLRAALEKYAEKHELSFYVRFYKAVTPVETRTVMEASHIFLFTSNHLEGWGAVVNEAMNSALAVVASELAGSVPFLIEDGKNGLVYRRGSYADFERQLLRLVYDRALCERLGRAAFATIIREWNAHTAAGRMYAFCESLLKNGRPKDFSGTGPLSSAPVIRPPKSINKKEPNRQDHG
ncbi:MAG: glycosyltransferase family 4 protein [Lachnospiraceae bacterium]|nr:glycosyltransferase family 4 protein [Lachnospiraceae bacterium]